MDYVFAPPAPASVPVVGRRECFPVHRIYCVGRNYAEHAREMGAAVERGTPMFFMKPADALVIDGADVPYPPITQDLHHEVEMVLALGRGGRDLDAAAALDCVWGYGVGLDLTRRDLQAEAKAEGHPWDVAKGFDASAPISALRAVSDIGHPRAARLRLTVNGALRQEGDIADMLFGVADIVRELSKLFTLMPGDLVYTGTPAGVAALQRGDAFVATLDGVGECRGRIV